MPIQEQEIKIKSLVFIPLTQQSSQLIGFCRCQIFVFVDFRNQVWQPFLQIHRTQNIRTQKIKKAAQTMNIPPTYPPQTKICWRLRSVYILL